MLLLLSKFLIFLDLLEIKVYLFGFSKNLHFENLANQKPVLTFISASDLVNLWERTPVTHCLRLPSCLGCITYGHASYPTSSAA